MKTNEEKILELFDILWSEERVEKILHSDWEEILQKTLDLSVDINKSLEDLVRLSSREQKEDYIGILPDDLKDSLLVLIAKKMKNFQEKSFNENFESPKKVVFH